MKNTHCSYDSSRAGESERLSLARKEMKDAWIGLIIVSIVMAALFHSAWWSLIPRVVLFIHAIDKTAKYSRIKDADRRLKAQESRQRQYGTPTETSYYGKPEQPTIITSPSKATSGFCPLCGQKHERDAVFCSACGTDLRQGA
ncbi:zinc ribbon domain-containing protein [Promethearchaeum syntrophicum]|uniref:Zinc ribbon domain-containing protein n=1 Tax=Promethearchaeum syntrophicum TaxID=2594042 RepID=A0A5B9DFF5_9ARCH|nr:zinc ribbon domain-containing protein [Candidatus Prometheoarchaeum syntrophicum]QEE18018.1 hypothetical protein DSAG12_03856 [Candidatus Prometheoarchaeum syntrophicum]